MSAEKTSAEKARGRKTRAEAKGIEVRGIAAEGIEASYRFCRSLSRRARSNFYPCFLLLPAGKRRAMDALYAFMRYTDDLADNAAPLPERREMLTRWKQTVAATLDGSTDPLPFEAGEPPSETGRQLLPALVDAASRFEIPPEHLFAVLDGVAMDLSPKRYATFDELVGYCERVASAVGLACIHVWGFRGPEAFEPARKCGIAMQMTNILRDVKEDAAEGRFYLPEDDLAAFGYSADDLAAGTLDERFCRLIDFQVDRVRSFYREGAELFDRLEPDGRSIFGMMITVYSQLLEAIARRPGEVLSRRVRLSRSRKLAIAARWLLLPARRSSLP